MDKRLTVGVRGYRRVGEEHPAVLTDNESRAATTGRPEIGRLHLRKILLIDLSVREWNAEELSSQLYASGRIQ